MSTQKNRTNILSALVFGLGVFLILYAAAKLGPARAFGIGATAAVVCGAIGAVVGAGIGMVTAGIGIPATVPLSLAFAAMCGYAGPIAVALGFGRPPIWAMPVFIIGWCLASGTIAISVYRWWIARRTAQQATEAAK